MLIVTWQRNFTVRLEVAVDSVHRLEDLLDMSAQANADRIVPRKSLLRQLQYFSQRETLGVRAVSGTSVHWYVTVNRYTRQRNLQLLHTFDLLLNFLRKWQRYSPGSTQTKGCGPYLQLYAHPPICPGLKRASDTARQCPPLSLVRVDGYQVSDWQLWHCTSGGFHGRGQDFG